eukprot:1156806-Pelagomonas_calceolata.AAC.5
MNLNRKLFPILSTPLGWLLSTSPSPPPPAHNRWPPGHTGRILVTTCRLGGAAGGLGHTGGEFGWVSAQTGRPSAQQASPDRTTAQCLKITFFYKLLDGMLRIGRGALDGIRKDITQGLGG